jgi:hypothetical protein
MVGGVLTQRSGESDHGERGEEVGEELLDMGRIGAHSLRTLVGRLVGTPGASHIFQVTQEKPDAVSPQPTRTSAN